MSQAAEGLFQQVLGTLGRATPQIQQAVVAPVNDLAQQIRSAIEGRKFKGADIKEQIEEFVSRDLPALFRDILGPLQQAVQRVDPLVQQFTRFIDGATQALVRLRQARTQLEQGIDAQIKALTEGTFTPAQTFETRRRELATVQGQFASATPAQRLQLAPQIQALVGEIFQLGRQPDVLGQEPAAVRALQQDLVSALTTLRTGTGESFDTLGAQVQQQIDLATQQIDVLTASLTNLGSIDAHIQEAVAVLQQLATGTGLPSFQHGTAYVPQTGLAWLHQGERVVPSHGGGSGASIVIHVHGAADPDRTAEAVVRHIERQSAFETTTIPTRRRNLQYTH